MRVLKKIKSINELIEVKYPRYDGKKVQGLDPDIEYFIIKEKKPEITTDQYLSFSHYSLTNIPDNEFPDLNIAYKEYLVNNIVIVTDEKEERIKDLESAIEILSKDKKDWTVEESNKMTQIIAKIKEKEILTIKTF